MNRFTADALRLTASELSVYIRGVRGKLARGNLLSARVVARDYLRLLKDLHELQILAIEEGMTGELVEPFTPVPFRDQLVGIPAAERRALEWRPYNA